MLFRAVDGRENEEVIGDIGQGDPHLGAVENVMIAVTDDGGLDRTGIGASIRLGETEGCDFGAMRLRNKPALLLLLSAPLQESETIEADVHTHDHAQERVDVFELVASECEGDVVEAKSAV